MTNDFKEWLYLSLAWVGMFYLVLLVSGCAAPPVNPCDQVSDGLGVAAELFTTGPYTIQTENGPINCNIET